MAGNFLPSLYRVDKDVYFKITEPLAVQILRNCWSAGKQQNNENLTNSAEHMAAFLFGDIAYANGQKRPEGLQLPKRDEGVANERAQFEAEKYQVLHSEVNDTVRTKLRMEIRKGLDPGKVFSDFTANLLVDKIMQELGAQLESDKKHLGVMNSLWAQAKRAGFRGNWKDRLVSAYLSGARPVMPGVRTRIRSEASKGQQSQNEDRRETATRSSERKEVRGTTGRQSGVPKNIRPNDVDWSKTSDEDFLNDKVNLKKR
jgi:hypothetical protein